MASWFDELDLGETTAAGMMTNKWVSENGYPKIVLEHRKMRLNIHLYKMRFNIHLHI